MPINATLTCTSKGEWLEVIHPAFGRLCSPQRWRTVSQPSRPVFTARKLSLNMAGIRELDTLGAWLLERMLRTGRDRNIEVQIVGLADRYRGLFDQVNRVNRHATEAAASKNKLLELFKSIGHSAIALNAEFIYFLEMLAALSFASARLLFRPRDFRSPPLCIICSEWVGSLYQSCS